MKQQNIALLVFLTISSQGLSQPLTAYLEPKQFQSFSVNSIFLNPSQLLKWNESPIPIDNYSLSQLRIQQKINEHNADNVVTYAPKHEAEHWTEIDREPITPYSWRWIDFMLLEDTSTQVSLRRPNKWLENLGANEVGDIVQLELSEMGVVGEAIVKGIRINQVDTRIWNDQRNGDYVVRPITGKFVHKSDQVYQLSFCESVDDLKVTARHPIWSEDRKHWVAAEQLRINERIKTYKGIERVRAQVPLEGIHTVYNVEVYRTHSFLVSKSQILVHNICWDELAKTLKEKIRRVIPVKGIYIDWIKDPPPFMVSKGEGYTFHILYDDFLATPYFMPAKAEELAIRKGYLKVVARTELGPIDREMKEKVHRLIFERNGYTVEAIEENGKTFIEAKKMLPAYH